MNEPIELTSPNNPKIQQVRQLRESKWRRRNGLFLIDGVDEIESAAKAGLQIEAVFSTDQRPLSTTRNSVDSPITQYRLTPNVMAKIGYGHRDDQPVAVAKTPRLSLDRLSLDDYKRIIVLDQAEKPGNVGACLRTAAACSVDALILSDPICEVFNPNTIRASRGACFRVPLAVVTAEELLASVPPQFDIWTARVDGEQNLWGCDFSKPHCIVLGNEAEGLGDNWTTPRTKAFRIPMDSGTDSLNLSNSCAVALYEARRQSEG